MLDVKALPEKGESGGPAPPAHGTRAQAPGPCGCWALKKDGSACHAPKRGDSDYCNAHGGFGVASNPRGYMAKGHQASADARRRRAELRVVLGGSRSNSPRSALRALAVLNSERIAGRTLSAALDPDQRPDQALNGLIKLIDAVDPPVTATLSETLTVDDVDNMGLHDLMAYAMAHGIEPASLSTSDSPVENHSDPPSPA